MSVAPVDVISVIISDWLVKGYISVAPRLFTILYWVKPLEFKKSLVRLGYFVAILNLLVLLFLKLKEISSKSAIVWTSIQSSGKLF